MDSGNVEHVPAFGNIALSLHLMSKEKRVKGWERLRLSELFYIGSL